MAIKIKIRHSEGKRLVEIHPNELIGPGRLDNLLPKLLVLASRPSIKFTRAGKNVNVAISRSSMTPQDCDMSEMDTQVLACIMEHFGWKLNDIEISRVQTFTVTVLHDDVSLIKNRIQTAVGRVCQEGKVYRGVEVIEVVSN